MKDAFCLMFGYEFSRMVVMCIPTHDTLVSFYLH